jgi:hypothetical protein
MRPSVLGERQIPDPNRTEHVVLGQRETVVGQVRLRADDDEVVVVTPEPTAATRPAGRLCCLPRRSAQERARSGSSGEAVPVTITCRTIFVQANLGR